MNETRQYKVRVVTKERNRVTFGVTIPNEFKHWSGTFVTFKQSGNCLIIESGAVPNIFDMESYKDNIKEVVRI